MSPPSVSMRPADFREAQEALVFAISAVVRNRKADPFSLEFVFVHKTSAEMYRAAMSNGATEVAGDFAILIRGRSHSPNDPLRHLGADLVACMISIDNRHKALGLPLDALSLSPGGEA